MPIYTPHAGHEPGRGLPTGLCQRALRSSIRPRLPSRSHRPSVVPPTISGLSMGRLRGGSCGCSSTGGLRFRVLGRGETTRRVRRRLDTPQAARCSVARIANLSFASSRVRTTPRARRCMPATLELLRPLTATCASHASRSPSPRASRFPFARTGAVGRRPSSRRAASAVPRLLPLRTGSRSWSGAERS